MRKEIVIKTMLSILFLIIIFAFFVLLNYLKTTEKYEKEIQRIKEEIEKQKQRIDKIYQGKVEIIATGYTSNLICCGKDDGITASGRKATWGTIAMDKKYKFGTKVYIPFFQKTFTVWDRGGLIKGNKVDIWFPTYEQALKFGVKKLIAYILD